MQQRAGIDGHHVLHAVFELAHVARPIVGEHDFHRLGRDVVVAADAGQKMIDQRGDVFFALAQRRQTNVDDVQPEIKVAAKGAFFHFLGQIAIGGGDDAEIRAPGDQRSHRTEFLFLQDPQQLGLQVQGQLADFVEKRGAAVGRFDQTRSWRWRRR